MFLEAGHVGNLVIGLVYLHWQNPLLIIMLYTIVYFAQNCKRSYDIMSMHADTAATVDFSQPSYNTSEGEGLLQVCASISVELEVNVSVNILSEDITAQGVYACVIHV